MDSLWCPVLFAALAVSLCSSPAIADRKFGKHVMFSFPAVFNLCSVWPVSFLILHKHHLCLQKLFYIIVYYTVDLQVHATSTSSTFFFLLAISLQKLVVAFVWLFAWSSTRKSYITYQGPYGAWNVLLFATFAATKMSFTHAEIYISYWFNSLQHMPSVRSMPF